MIYSKQINKAIKIAFKAHINQTDFFGVPYIFHPWEVANKVGDDEKAVIVALLHDVIEDTDITYDDLRKEGFSEEIIEGIKGVTKIEGEDYMDFVKRAKQNEISRKVKIADLKHNMDLTRLEVVTERDLIRQEKYKKALEYLLKEDK